MNERRAARPPALVLLCLAAVLLATGVAAAKRSHRHGHRHVEFRHRGKKTLRFGSSAFESAASAYPGGRVLLLGRREGTSGLLRLRRNGSPDHSFARTGFLPVNASDFAVRSNGKIVVVSLVPGPYGRGELAVSVLRRHGGVERDFGANGTSLIDFGRPLGGPPRVTLAPGGDIVVATAVATTITRRVGTTTAITGGGKERR